jgi:hypothetical protein
MKDHALRTMFSRGAPHPWEYQAGLQLTASVAEPDHREVVTSSVVDSVRNELNLEISYSGDRNRLFNVDAFVTQRREKQRNVSSDANLQRRSLEGAFLRHQGGHRAIGVVNACVNRGIAIVEPTAPGA